MRKRLLVLLLCAGPALAATEVYKWTDADGVVHYSDTEPAHDLNAQRVRVTGLAASDGDEAAAPQREPADAIAGTGATGADSDANAAKNCTSAHAQLELLQSDTPVGMASAGANAKPLDPAARQAQIARAQSLIATYCK